MRNLLEIIKAPNKKLYKKAQKVIDFDQKLHDFAQDMLYTMKEFNGCGLASIQVEDDLRFKYEAKDKYRAQPDIFIIYPNKDEDPIFIINAKIIDQSIQICELEEGCLSIPEKSFKTKLLRSKSIKVEYQNLQGKIIQETLNGMYSRIFQHEYDHNQGILFPNRLSKKKEELFWKKYLQ